VLLIDLTRGNSTRYKGKPAGILLVTRRPDADAKVAAKALRIRVADLVKWLPEGLEATVIDPGPYLGYLRRVHTMTPPGSNSVHVSPSSVYTYSPDGNGWPASGPTSTTPLK
jgi:hypothetical protein